MANDLNQCNFIGRVGKSPDIKFTKDGTAIVNFSIACGGSWKDGSGNKQEKTEWIRCVAWRKLAEIIGGYVKKGDQIYISGKYITRTWEKDGVTRYTTEIVVNNMQMLGGRKEQKPAQESVQPEERKAHGSGDTESDIPF